MFLTIKLYYRDYVQATLVAWAPRTRRLYVRAIRFFYLQLLGVQVGSVSSVLFILSYCSTTRKRTNLSTFTCYSLWIAPPAALHTSAFTRRINYGYKVNPKTMKKLSCLLHTQHVTLQLNKKNKNKGTSKIQVITLMCDVKRKHHGSATTYSFVPVLMHLTS